ncbi:MAG: DNA-directed RNA polymerase subunit beta' [Candidatus Peregrinibacteria bacterium]|nr:DNA-directed RNA polymerase subunit beta' [Candidatus Peregrinibacteria bacterium]MDZ4245015.1 DNA-directed RNA polymerase subunit beta' [Candidatus Gracilibacteria bacterium]
MNKKLNQDPGQFNAIAVAVASPEQILSWSHGEVKKPETINYRTQKPEKDGLFCEKIFGPTKNYECYCGKYKGVRYKGVICEKCGVEVTRSVVRRERMGHIRLAVPVTHIWFLRSTPSRIGLLLDLPIKAMEQVIYFAAYIVSQVDEKAKEEAISQVSEEFKAHKQRIQKEFKNAATLYEQEIKSGNKAAEKNLQELEQSNVAEIERLTEQVDSALSELKSIKETAIFSELEYRELSMKFGHVFKGGIGAEAIREVISKIDLEELIKRLEQELKKASGQKQKKIIKRIKLAGSLLQAGIKPEWMVSTVLPVIPPDLRPMVQLDGGRFAASDLNDLYRRVINRNNRLKRLMSIGAPEVICRNEKRMLQEAVDTLINNSARQGKTVFNSGDKRKLRSLSDMLKGKQGRFRQNLLGKRVDYSGRSVIVVGPKLRLNQCGIPKSMALELFRPFVIGRLIKDGYAHNIKSAEKFIQQNKREVWDILEEVTQNRYVLLNRAPTLHRLGIQAFQPVLIEGKAIQIHPLVCTAFNADFDGDQMAVHLPLSEKAQKEAQTIMSAGNNVLKPAAGEPIITPTQDMILGCYYLTQMMEGKTGEGKPVADLNDAIALYRLGAITLHSRVMARPRGEIIETTVGRLIFNSFVPEAVEYVNENITKKKMISLISDIYDKCGEEITARFCDEAKRIGFKFATKSGISIASSDMVVPAKKQEILDEANEIVRKINNQYWKGFITVDERYHNAIKIWNRTKADIAKEMIKGFDQENDIFYQIDSGARGNWGQITQLCGMKGLVANPAGKTIELPIKSNLKEGFSILEYFIATHGGRKGKSDTALKTAEAGYLTRRLVDAVQDVVIREIDCGSKAAHLITREESAAIGEEFGERIFGRVLAEEVKDTKGKAIVKKGIEIDKDTLKLIEASNVEEVHVRSVITCLTPGGICQKCYGRDLGKNATVRIGTAVGIIAAQSIGEPGTQLTMRTFHMGGIATEGQDITQGLTRVEELFEARPPKSPAILSEIDGIVKITSKAGKKEIAVTSKEPIEKKYLLADGFEASVKKGDKVKEKQAIARNVENKKNLRVGEDGIVSSVSDLEIIIKSDGVVTKTYKVPAGRNVKVRNNQDISAGTVLTTGHVNLRDLLGLQGIYAVQKYIITEVQSIYASQGQTINDKHIEIIARQMLSKVRVITPEALDLLPGQVIDVIEFDNANKGSKKPALAERLLLGLTRISLQTDSWLSAASFQETIRVLVEASTTKKIDKLSGLKENVIIGKLIPADAIFRKANGFEE